MVIESAERRPAHHSSISSGEELAGGGTIILLPLMTSHNTSLSKDAIARIEVMVRRE
ncbi:MAG: hypothetical protein U0X39_12775 [Bacteroidales bacterium]